MEFSCEALLDEMAQKQYKYLKFGGSPVTCIGLLGKASAKSVEKIRDTYQIPKDELIAAHLTKKILLITDGVLMTDRALYVNPSGCPNGVSNRIPWSELHKYFVSHPNDTAATILYQPGSQRYLLLHPTLLDTISGEELTAFLLEMQSEIIKRYPKLQVRRQEVFQSLKSEFENILASNILDEDQKSVLKNLFYEPALAEEAAMVLSAHYARIYPRQQYEQWIKALPDVFSAAFRERLTTGWDAASEKLLKSLRKEPTALNQGFLSELYKNYESGDALSSKETMILARACAVLKKWENIDHIIQMLKTYDLGDAISDLYVSKFIDANERMLSVAHAIQSGQNPLSWKATLCQDSMGLTPLHYALIFADKKSQLSAILSKKYPELPENQRTAFGEVGIYDLLTLAVFKKAPFSVLEKMILRTDEGAKQLKKVVSSLRAEGVADSVINVLLNCALTAVNTATSKGYSVDCSEEQYASMAEERKKLGKAISRTDARIEQARYEFYEYIANVIQAAEQRIDAWRRSSSQTVQYLLHLYSDPNYLEKILANEGRWKLYATDNGFFYMAPEGEIESHHPPEDNAPEEMIGSERLFGDSWFSEKAHVDMEVLKKEFRGLAKKYHPDVSSETQAADIFKEISAEYDLLRWSEEDSSQ